MIGNRIAEKNYTEAASKSTHENLKKSTQPTELRKEIYVPAEKRQQMNFDYYNYKYIVKMAYEKITNLQNQTGKQVKFFTLLLTSILCYYSDAYILVKRTIIAGKGADTSARNLDAWNKQITFRNCDSFTNCISQINNTLVDNPEYLGVWCPCIIQYNTPVTVCKNNRMFMAVAQRYSKWRDSTYWVIQIHISKNRNNPCRW